MPHFTPTEQRMLKILSDGFPHHKSELQACLYDEESTIRQHIYNIRAKLRPRGEDIVCELRLHGIHYRHVRLLASPYDE